MDHHLPKRNDPCPCGSGKLYKHCCKPGRRATAAQRRPIALKPAHRRAGAAPSVVELRHLLEDYRGVAPPDRMAELERLLDLAHDMTAYQERQAEIEAASDTLEAHRAEFEALDLGAKADLAGRLFTEERFHPWRFTAEEVHRAFEAVGYPQHSPHEFTERDGEIVRDAILHLTKDQLRAALARKLMMWLPEYVAAGRYMEAWILQFSAYNMLEVKTESNPFLGEMFRYGFDQWVDQIQARREQMVQEVGLDPAQATTMTPGELEAWLEARLADPETRSRFEAHMHSALISDQAMAELWAAQVESVRLLERDDAEEVLLAPEEVGPWLPTVLERLKPFEQQAAAAAEGKDWQAAGVLEAMSDVLFETAEEMAPVVFTPARVKQLAADLRHYSEGLGRAGDRAAALHAHLTARMLANSDEPAAQHFLIGVCMASLRLMLLALSERARRKMPH